MIIRNVPYLLWLTLRAQRRRPFWQSAVGTVSSGARPRRRGRDSVSWE